VNPKSFPISFFLISLENEKKKRFNVGQIQRKKLSIFSILAYPVFERITPWQ